jgi:C4-dicarboxylate-specific signal transduction histidine kinase
MAAIGQLAAGVAHEVLNPLTGISCLVQILEREERTESDMERLALIKDHIARITKIVGEFQHFSLPSASKGRALISVTGLLDQALELLSYDKRTIGVEISLDAPPDLEPLRADASRIGVVFTNLALNAVYALKEGGGEAPKLEVTARREGNWLIVRFADNGPGMSELDKSNAFEPFFTTKPTGEGTGLGLWVCYEAVRGHGGRISLLDRPGGGLEVKVELPY